MNQRLKPYLFAFAILGFDGLLLLFHPAWGWGALRNAIRFFGEVALVIPTITVLIGLFDVWVPRHLVENNIGPQSGFRGVALSMLLGTAAAGPIYAAFPVGQSLRGKGARWANLVIFLGTWATIKLPMILMESSFLGLRFAMIRLALTAPGVVAIGFVMERLMLDQEAA